MAIKKDKVKMTNYHRAILERKGTNANIELDR